LATQEDHELLKQHFPEALAWGQAGSYGGGVVMTPTPDGAQDGGKDVGRVEVESGVVGRRTSSRKKKSNTRVSGPQWV
jgi:hypothetical protein